ncbi:MAG: tRNA lysidine(34) synthetase TilS [Eubacterium sp.]|nr:tRNA lysidine(34) synthetase TilS [Eubacterium sp.]
MNQNRFERDFIQYIKAHGLLTGGERVIVGLSGGADSVALLTMLAKIRDKFELSIVAVHVHHGIRGDEADRDEIFSEDIAKKMNIEYVCKRCDAPGYAKENGLTLEEAARILRYKSFDEVLSEKKAELIALAHHMDDQAETVLMNIFRGTGPAGLAGIRPKSENRIRPLLFATKKEILEYLSAAGIDHVEDSTNACTEHTRNRIRNEIMPLAEELYPGAGKHIASLAEDMLGYRTLSEKKAKDISHGNKIVIPEYLKQDGDIKHELLKQAIETVIPGTKDVSRKHYAEIDSLISDKRAAGKRISLPGHISAVRSYDELVIKKDEQCLSEMPEQILNIPGETVVENRGERVIFTTKIMKNDEFDTKNLKFEEKDYTKHIKYDRIDGSVVLRNPREGDFLLIGPKEEKKLLSRYYIDSKVPREDRPHKLVLAAGKQVICAFPDRLNDAFRVDDDTKQILEIKWTVEEVAYGRDHNQKD